LTLAKGAKNKAFLKLHEKKATQEVYINQQLTKNKEVFVG
jgi:hypothetical protein